MSIISITGAIYGDEGKAKVADFISKDADVVVKFQGGSNAGNTAVVDGKEYILHVMPVGAIRGIRSLIAAGVVLHPERISEEIDFFNGEVNLGIDPRTELVFPYHIALDIARDRSVNQIGTTKQGIGPAYKSSRKEPRFFDLVKGGKHLEEMIRYNYKIYQSILEKTYYSSVKVPKGGKYDAPLVKISEDETVARYMDAGKNLKRYMVDVSKEVRGLIARDKNVLFQGSQGANLDYRFGNYPKVTCSQPIPSSIFGNVGIPPMAFKENIGIVKAYTSKVGHGPVVTCLDGNRFPVDEQYSEDIGIQIRNDGKEFGATTGRKRRVGWLDLVQLKDRCRICGYTQLAVTKLDVLGDKGPLKLAVVYEVDGKWDYGYDDYDLDKLYRTKPIYIEEAGFSKQAVIDAKNFDELPRSAKNYLDTISRYADVPVTFISTGAEREKTILNGFRGF
ncbi:MAG: adenylosuccinate synthetase [Nanoarchaeota archaeon]|nr:adenylosuccinate synthetase [Nanoarchaeota archaeon]